MSEIRRLVSRYEWLEADMAYKAAVAPTDEESDVAFLIPDNEQEEIESRLATLVPETFSGACCLLDFATGRAEQGGRHGLDMLRNVRKGLRTVRRDELLARDVELEADRQKARKEGSDTTRRAIEIAFTVGDTLDGIRKERAAA